MKIAFLGLGNMGKGMALNLLNANHEVHIYDVNAEAMSELEEYNFVTHNSIDDAVENVEVVITMLPEGKHVKDVYLGDKGVINNVKPNTILIDCSTIDMNSLREVEKKAKIKGLLILDAPVSGGVVGADNGTLTFMVGAGEDEFNLISPLLLNMGKKVVHAGDVGAGQAAKICNNMILGTTMVALSESFTMAKKLGLDLNTFFEISSKATGMSWAMLNHLPVAGIIETAAANNNYKPGFAASMMLKDLTLAQDSASSVNLETPLGALTQKLYKQFTESGNGELDYTAIIKMIEKN